MKNNNLIRVLAVRMAACLLCLIGAQVAVAGVEDVPGLTESQANAAVAVESILNDLQARIDNDETLSEAEQALYDGALEIVHTGNQILNALFGAELPTTSSLNLNAEGFAGVLQWVTHEEITAQGQLSSEALGAQSANIGARLDALRMGARGFQLAWQQQVYPGVYADHLGGNASAELSDNIPKWGFFLNGGAGAGERDPTELEDAFEFDTWSITAGADYKYNADLILGVALGLSESQVEFDSSKSIVEGEIDNEAWLFTAFASYQWQDLYLDGAFTYGQTEFDLERRISYPSQNVLIAATNELALASTDGELLSLSLQSGWILTHQHLTFGPTFALDYVTTDIDGYTETNADEFNLTIKDQDIDSLTTRVGGRVQVALNQTWGVFVPQFDIEWVHEFEDDSRQVGAKFADDVTDSFFNVVTDEPDSDYYIASVSFSAVLQQGIQGFFNYKKPLGLENVSSSFISGGARWEF